MATVNQGQLDRILAVDSNYEMTQRLRSFLAEHDTVTLRSADGDLTFSYGGREYQASEKRGLIVSPYLAVQLLNLYGRTGNYYRFDPVTGVHMDRVFMLNDKEREYYRERFGSFNFQTAYLYHHDGSDNNSITLEPLEELEEEDEAPGLPLADLDTGDEFEAFLALDPELSASVAAAESDAATPAPTTRRRNSTKEE